MPDLDLNAITAARAKVSAAQDELRRTRFELVRARSRAIDARTRGDAAEKEAAEVEAQKLEQRRETLVGTVRETSASVRIASDALLAALAPEDAVASLSGRHPVLLLPVRLAVLRRRKHPESSDLPRPGPCHCA
jgi:hypothetical protein